MNVAEDPNRAMAFSSNFLSVFEHAALDFESSFLK